ncbi:MAG: hypothetical protein JWL89_219 [Candidatus Saccharibacteria bacterium]|nr:hypothetical protein [Candidatus Saccharibacteria bacterium]
MQLNHKHNRQKTMSNNGQPSLETPPLGEDSSHFRLTLTGEVDDAIPLPPDDRFVGAAVVRFHWVRAGALTVENEFIPSEDELSLPTKTTLIAVHNRLVSPSQTAPEDTSLFKFAKESRWIACQQAQSPRQRTLGGLVDYGDGVAGLFYSRFLAQTIERTAKQIAQIVHNGYGNTTYPEQEAILDDLSLSRSGIPLENMSKVLRLIIGCGLPRADAFKKALVLREQASESVKPMPAQAAVRAA